MSSFWSGWIIVLTLGHLIALIVLLRWNMKNYTDVAEGENMGHEFDGISELNHPLPKWWTYLFWICLVWAFIYLALYPGLGNFKGLLGWSSSNQYVLSLEDSERQRLLAIEEGRIVQYDRERARAQEVYGPLFASFANQTIEEIAADSEALRVGQRLFLQNCAQCHGSDARGGIGFPNLTDGSFNWGGSPAEIKQTIMQGRVAEMPPFEAQLGERGIEEMAAYVLSLSGRNVDRELARAGEANFAACAVCHGQDGRGNTLFGAPDLTDGVWLYGGSQRAIEETIRHGRNGVMPRWDSILGEDKVQILSGYIYSMNN